MCLISSPTFPYKKTSAKVTNINSFSSCHHPLYLLALGMCTGSPLLLYFLLWFLLLEKWLLQRQGLIEYHFLFEALTACPRLGSKQKLPPHFEPHVLKYNCKFLRLSPHWLLLLFGDTVNTNENYFHRSCLCSTSYSLGNGKVLYMWYFFFVLSKFHSITQSFHTLIFHITAILSINESRLGEPSALHEAMFLSRPSALTQQ